jgi:hypothetical protein
MKQTSVFAAASVLVLASACSQWTVIKQAEPNPYATGNCKVAVQPLDFTGMGVGNITEAEWLARKPAEETASYVADKQTMTQNFQTELLANSVPHTTVGGTAPYLLKARVTNWEPGFFTAFVNKASEASLVLQLTDDKGTVLDEIATSTQVPASIYNPSTGGRMHTAGKQLARVAAKYLAERLTCGK